MVDNDGGTVLGQQRPAVNKDGDGNTIWVDKSGGIISCRASQKKELASTKTRENRTHALGLSRSFYGAIWGGQGPR